jgi:hypothetical protein
MPDAPDGFVPHFRKSPVTDPWEPLYSWLAGTGAIDIGGRNHHRLGECNAQEPRPI